MGKKGTPHRKWSKEEKLQYIRLHLEKHISLLEIERKYGVRFLLRPLCKDGEGTINTAGRRLVRRRPRKGTV